MGGLRFDLIDIDAHQCRATFHLGRCSLFSYVLLVLCFTERGTVLCSALPHENPTTLKWETIRLPPYLFGGLTTVNSLHAACESVTHLSTASTRCQVPWQSGISLHSHELSASEVYPLSRQSFKQFIEAELLLDARKRSHRRRPMETALTPDSHVRGCRQDTILGASTPRVELLLSSARHVNTTSLRLLSVCLDVAVIELQRHQLIIPHRIQAHGCSRLVPHPNLSISISSSPCLSVRQ